jgi:hypothetical protein
VLHYKSVSQSIGVVASIFCLRERSFVCVDSSGGRGCSDNAVGSVKNLLSIDKYKEKPILWDPCPTCGLHTSTVEPSVQNEHSMRLTSCGVM